MYNILNINIKYYFIRRKNVLKHWLTVYKIPIRYDIVEVGGYFNDYYLDFY